jgi:hypothetical protein
LEEDRSRERAMLGSKMERLDRQFLKVEREARKEMSEKPEDARKSERRGGWRCR